jgi:hypothetical protein
LAYLKVGKKYSEVARSLRVTRDAVQLLDLARWHTADKLSNFANVLSLPAGSSELNSVEQIWQQ